MKSDYINPFIKATENTFMEMMNVKVENSNPYVYRGAEDLYDVSAIIGLAGEARGLVVLSFSRESCLKFSEAFTGIKSDDIDEIVCDAIGEIVNIIAGNSKEGLLQFRIYISLPKVVFGKLDMRLPRNLPTITVPYESGLGPFNLTVGLKEEEQTDR